MNAQKQQSVTIKGTKDGLTLHLDDSCSFEQLLHDLEEMLSSKQYIGEDGPIIQVSVQVGDRFVDDEKQAQIKAIIEKNKYLIIATIESNVITREEALRLKRETEIISMAKIVRSGQVLKIHGDLLLIGDVNPGGIVMASGNIFILGALKGIAHAGFEGNNDAVIAASIMKPSQLKINDVLNRAPDSIPYEGNEMECAYIDEEGKMIIERLQHLSHLRPNLSRFEGGI